MFSMLNVYSAARSSSSLFLYSLFIPLFVAAVFQKHQYTGTSKLIGNFLLEICRHGLKGLGASAEKFARIGKAETAKGYNYV